MKIIPQSYIEKMTDLELIELLHDSGPLSPKTRERASAALQQRLPHRPITHIYMCESCRWIWPLPGKPPEGSECDNCGRKLGADDM